jgi:hypothetical protein
MRNGQSSSSSGFQLNTTPVMLGAALIGAGVLIGLTGLIVGGTAMVSATRQWLGEMEVPPTEVVKQKLDQTKAATSAGASAWKEHNDTHHRSRHGTRVV